MRHLLLAAAFALAAASAAAQPGPLAGLFLSPMGEPFRGGEGAEAWFARADADHDGVVTAAEFQADADTLFGKLDANGDGRIDGFEMQAYERQMAPEITGAFFAGGGGGFDRPPRRGTGYGPPPRNRGPSGREGAGRFSYLDIPEPVTGADLDVDGKVTRDEWRRAAATRFALLDAAKSGRFALADLPPLGGRAPSGAEKRAPSGARRAAPPRVRSS
jgi:hypothetical protein